MIVLTRENVLTIFTCVFYDQSSRNGRAHSKFYSKYFLVHRLFHISLNHISLTVIKLESVNFAPDIKDGGL